MKEIEDLIVIKTATEKNIQAITGATISSEALTDSVGEKAKEILILRQRGSAGSPPLEPSRAKPRDEVEPLNYE